MTSNHNANAGGPSKPPKPKLGALGDRLAYLAGVLTDEDRQLYRLLAEHQVLTTPQCAMLVYGPEPAARRRLSLLFEWKVIDRFRPRPTGKGTIPHHYVLGESGVAILAAEQGRDPTRTAYRREQLLAIAHNQPALARALTINGFFAHLAAYARAHPGCRLVAWKAAHWCAERWGALIAPEAYGRWAHHHQEIDFFLHAQLPQGPRQLAGWMHGYDLLATHSDKATPVLFWLPPEHEPRLRAGLGEPLVPVATAPSTALQPAEAVWLPHPDPTGGARQLLIRLADPNLWAHLPRTARAARDPDEAAASRPDGRRTNPPTPAAPGPATRPHGPRRP